MGLKDTTFACSFDKKDLPSLYQLAEHIRKTHNNDLIDDFNLKCQKKVDDHNPVLEIGNQKIEFKQVSKADDLIVTTGINQCLDQILGVSTTRWQYMGKGTSNGPTIITQTALFSEVSPRVDMTLAGWREYAGSTLRFAGIFGDSHPTISVTECGVFTLSAGGLMLNRNMFNQNPISHVINVSAFLISCIIEFVPVMS
jgi:hypothetical protein